MRQLPRAFGAVLVVALAVTLGGCGNIFTNNLFQNFDGPPSASDLANLEGEALLNAVENAAQSNRFFDGLTNEQRDELTESLRTVYQDPNASAAERQRAAVLAGAVNIRGTAAETTINNVVSAFTSEEDAFDDPQALINSVIPASVRQDEAALTAMLTSMFAAAEAYNALGSGIGEDEAAVSVDGETAQNAAISILLYEVAGGDPDVLIAAINNDNYDDLNDPGNALGDDDNQTPLYHILQAAGLGGVFNGE